MYRQILLIIPNVKIHENPSLDVLTVLCRQTCGRTDRQTGKQDEANSLVASRNCFAKESGNSRFQCVAHMGAKLYRIFSRSYLIVEFRMRNTFKNK